MKCPQCILKIIAFEKNIEFSSPKFSCLIGKEDKNRFSDRKTDRPTDGQGKIKYKKWQSKRSVEETVKTFNVEHWLINIYINQVHVINTKYLYLFLIKR